MATNDVTDTGKLVYLVWKGVTKGVIRTGHIKAVDPQSKVTRRSVFEEVVVDAGLITPWGSIAVATGNSHSVAAVFKSIVENGGISALRTIGRRRTACRGTFIACQSDSCQRACFCAVTVRELIETDRSKLVSRG